MLLALWAPACLDGGDNKALTGLTSDHAGPLGPSVVFDPLRKPVPEVPFPNDLILTPSDQTASGSAWNVTVEAPTDGERRLRKLLNTLDGFGLFAPIFVRFDGPLDLSTLSRESVYVVNVEPGHAREGEIVPLDLGRGHFPTQRSGSPFWAFDERAALPDLVFPADNKADTDGDGELETVSHWEVATNTLILRPVIPLAPSATHAVVLTRDLLGWTHDEDGHPVAAPVRSPFIGKAHAAQVEEVARGVEILGLGNDDLAFGWSFTTSDPAARALAFRDGVHGEGPLAWMADEVPARLAEIHDQTITIDGDEDGDGEPDPGTRDHRWILQPQLVENIFSLIGGAVPLTSGFDFAGFKSIDYFVFGSFDSPNMRTGLDAAFGPNPHTGEGTVESEKIPFFLSVPQETELHKPPFPVMLYFHGTATSRMEVLVLVDALARQGIAALSFDEVGHGPIIPDLALVLAEGDFDISLAELLIPLVIDLIVPEMADQFEGLGFFEALDLLETVGFWRELAVNGRTEDTNGDGTLRSSESFFFANPFKQCASFMQDVVDIFQIVRMLREFDQDAVPDAIDAPHLADFDRLNQNLLAADFNADGILDIGGPAVPIGVAGTSLGGFHAAFAAAVEPEIISSTPIVGGGGYLDIMTRSRQREQTQWIFLETFGPLVIGCPDGSGGVWLSWNDDTDKCKAEFVVAKSFAHVAALPKGSLVRLSNLDNGESTSRFIGDTPGFSLAIAADLWDQIEVTVIPPEGERTVVPTNSPYKGVGLQRNTPRFRRFLALAQQVLGQCDPISVARNLFVDPLRDHPPTNMLLELALGDRTVPISTGVMLALAAGMFGTDESEWGPVMDGLIAQGVMEGSDYDVDDLFGDNPPEAPPMGPMVPIETGTGHSTVRFAHVQGHHEYVLTHPTELPSGEPFDLGLHSQGRIVLYHRSEGDVVHDDLCIAEYECPLLEPSP